MQFFAALILLTLSLNDTFCQKKYTKYFLNLGNSLRILQYLNST